MEMVLFHIWSTEHYYDTYNMALNHLDYSKDSDLVAQHNSKSKGKHNLTLLTSIAALANR